MPPTDWRYCDKIKNRLSVLKSAWQAGPKGHPANGGVPPTRRQDKNIKINIISLFKRKNQQESISEKSTIAVVIGFIFEVIQVIVISLAIIIPIRYFLIQPFYVKGASMEPNFYDHEYLIIDEISYRLTEPERGDIVVFRYPNDPKQYFIKRIIGLPGETVEIGDGRVMVYNDENPEGVIIEEGYVLEGYTIGNKKVKLRGDEYFMMGDNRSSSLDSRSFGPVNRDYFIGKVWLRGWPITKIKIFQTPEYNT